MREAHQHNDVNRFVDTDLAFHNTLFKAADNVFLDVVFEPLAAVLRTLRTATSSVTRIREHGLALAATSSSRSGTRTRTPVTKAIRAHLARTQGGPNRYLHRTNQTT